VTLVPYPSEATLREARRTYFDANGFGDDGGYSAAWVDFKLGSLPFPFPNTAGRVRAVRYHDLNHVLTGYDTDLAGEYEISAWEVASGCRDFAAAWQLNLAGMAGGMLYVPRRTFRAFVRGRRCRSLYGEPFDDLLDLRVGEARARFLGPDPSVPATLGDRLHFVAAAGAAWVVGLLMLAVMLPLVPVGLLWMAWHARRATGRNVDGRRE